MNALPLIDTRIFIIEDNVENRAIMQTLLEFNGAKTSFERWGLQSVERLQAFAPVDIILLDLMFPRGVTGYGIFDQIRQYPEFDQVPIVAVSASEPSVAIPKVRTLGFQGFIPKPISYEQFPHQVAQIIKGEQVW